MDRGIKRMLWSMLGFGFVLELILVPAILYWPIFKENVGVIRPLIPLMKGRDLLGLTEATGIVGYVSLQQFFKGCNILGILAAVLFAVGAVAGEAHRGTMEIWLARPVSRMRMLMERYVQGALATLIPVFVTSLTIPWLLSQVEETMEYWPLVLCAVHQSAYLLAIYSGTFLASATGRRPVPIASAMLFFYVAMGAVYFIQDMTDYSTFRLVDIPRFVSIFDTGRLNPTVVGPLLGASVVFVALSAWVFKRRTP